MLNICTSKSNIRGFHLKSYRIQAQSRKKAPNAVQIANPLNTYFDGKVESKLIRRWDRHTWTRFIVFMPQGLCYVFVLGSIVKNLLTNPSFLADSVSVEVGRSISDLLSLHREK